MRKIALILCLLSLSCKDYERTMIDECGKVINRLYEPSYTTYYITYNHNTEGYESHSDDYPAKYGVTIECDKHGRFTTKGSDGKHRIMYETLREGETVYIKSWEAWEVDKEEKTREFSHFELVSVVHSKCTAED